MDVFEDTREVSALVAFPPREGADTSGPVDEESFYPYTLYLTGLLVSLPFLVATLAVYACFSELQNLHGKSLICHVTAMILAYVVLVLVYFKVGIENNVMCVVFGFGVQYFFLVTFSWLNVMCFDIWWTFSGFGAVHGAPSVPDRERFRFVAYSAYAWGVPSAILVVTLVLQLAGDSLPTSVPRPDVGSERCLLGPKANLAYFLGPVAVLLVCNVVLFVHTAVRIVRLRRETRALKSAESRRHSDERQRYNVYLKLFVIMGVNWIAEVASAFFPDFSYLWIVPDITNSLQGIFIFMMFVATGRVRRLVVDRLLHRVRPHVTSNSSTKSTRANASSSRKSAPPPPPGAANGCLPPTPTARGLAMPPPLLPRQRRPPPSSREPLKTT